MSGPASPMGISWRTIIGGDRHRPWNRPVTRPMGLPPATVADNAARQDSVTTGERVHRRA